jgi:hypothetical protein
MILMGKKLRDGIEPYIDTQQQSFFSVMNILRSY